MTRRSATRGSKRQSAGAGSTSWCGGPAKRVRSGSGAKVVKNGNMGCLLDLLQRELLEHILRYISEKPLSKQWADYMHLEEVKVLVDVGHPLREVARSRFSVIMASDMFPYERRGLLVHGRNRQAQHSFRNTAFFLKDVVTDVFIYQTQFPPMWKRTLKNVCPGLKSLSLNSASMSNIFPLEELLQPQNRLESLEIAWSDCTVVQIEAMEKCLKGLRRLSIMFDLIHKSFDRIWETVGPSLVDLAVLELGSNGDIRQANYNKLKLSNLRSVCPHIVKLDFELPPETARSELVSLFEGYGDALRTCILIRCGLEPVEIARICAACQSVRLDLAEYRGLPVESLLAAGRHASLVNFGCNTFESYDEYKLGELGDSLTNLSGFCVSAYSSNVERGISSVFKYPNNQLTFARIENDNEQINTPLTQIITDRFPALEQIEITEMLPNFDLLRELGPRCPKVKELIFLNIFPITKLCMCKVKKANQKKITPHCQHNIRQFISAVSTFPALEDVDYSCNQFDGARTAVVANVAVLLKRKLCLTMCGNNYK